MAESLILEPVAQSAAAPTTASALSRVVSVVVVGQVPPPMNGQSLMISEFLAGRYSGLQLEHVPMAFSRSTAEIGAFGIRKFGLLFVTLAKIVRARFRTKAQILYYPPAGANLVPVLRDLFLLILCRWLFRYTVFHFHAAGLHNIYPQLPKPLRFLFRLAYNKPDLAIFTTRSTSAEAALLDARATAIIPCGAHDAGDSLRPCRTAGEIPIILYAGILCDGKGLSTLLDACVILRDRGVPFRLVCLGAFQPAAFRDQVQEFICRRGLEHYVEFPGVVTGEAKSDAFASASIFCFPSHYPAESFGVVLIEAMSFALPIVATEWQGIPEVTGSDGGSRLVPIKQPTALADALQALLLSPETRTRMGQQNRERFLQRFTLSVYRENLHQALLNVASGAPPILE
jgi:glycosyltransferase involved in cell wall biosynthesis